MTARGALMRAAPVALALVLCAGFWTILRAPDHGPASPMVGRPAPTLVLPPRPDGPAADLAALAAEGPIVVNFWASWCAPCRIEHPLLQALAEDGVTIVGVEYRDRPEDADRFLAALGDPFAARAADPDGATGFDWGVTAVPETFVIGPDGVVRAHVRRALTERVLAEEIRPALADG